MTHEKQRTDWPRFFFEIFVVSSFVSACVLCFLGFKIYMDVRYQELRNERMETIRLSEKTKQEAKKDSIEYDIILNIRKNNDKALALNRKQNRDTKKELKQLKNE